MSYTPEEITVEKPLIRSRGGLHRKEYLPKKGFLKSGDVYLSFSITGVVEKTTVWITNNKKLDVYYRTPSKYIVKTNDVRKAAVLIGLKQFNSVVKGNDLELDDKLIEKLFEESRTKYFLSEDGGYLLASDSEVIREKYGRLQPFNSLAALKRFGISALEESIERGIVKVNGRTN